MKIAALSNEELLSGLSALVGEGRPLLARLIAYLGEVEERRLHLDGAYPSLFDFCVRRFSMSDGEAFRRITAARLARRFPIILAKLEQGSIHLSALVLLRDHLTDSNHADLLGEASGKTKREVQKMLAARFPKPDVPTSIRRLPSSDTASQRGSNVKSASDTAPPPAPRDAVGQQSMTLALSATRYRVQFTASDALKDKLTKATELMRHRNPSGDLAVVVERAVDLLIRELEKERFGKTERPRKEARPVKPTRTRAGYIPSAVRREVYERDGGQCAFVDEQGHRCPCKDFLEFDHAHAKALGGTADPANIRLMCRMHNRRLAERTFGREHVDRRVRMRQRKCTSLAVQDVQCTPDSSDGSEPPGPTLELVERALKNLGFRDAEARGAIGVVRDRLDARSGVGPLSIEDVLREALRVLA